MLHLEIAHIHRVAEQMQALCGDDDECFADMLVGETNIDRLVGRIHEQVARDDETLVGIGERQASLAERKARITRRRDAMKQGIGKLLRAGRLSKLELPEVTYSVRDGKASLKVVDPDGVPEELQRIKREPDKTKINEAFADLDDLPNWLVREPANDIVTGRVK